MFIKLNQLRCLQEKSSFTVLPQLLKYLGLPRLL